MIAESSPQDAFTEQERARLAPFFSNLDRPVFALTNLPEIVKAALFARYSRSPKSLRRLFLDEFLDELDPGVAARAGEARAERLLSRVLGEFGDDSVAQLGGAHVACEGVSNVATKLLEWGRLAAYLEQSTRYIPYTDKPGGAWRYAVPPELERDRALGAEFRAAMDLAFETYAALLPVLRSHLEATHPCPADVPPAAHARAVAARALDAARGLLPAATRSNLGVFASAQSFEALVLRLRAHPLAEARGLGEQILGELRAVIPAFLENLDRPERGGVWVEYLRQTREQTRAVAAEVLGGLAPTASDEVALIDWDAEGEDKVLAAILYPASELAERQLLAVVRTLTHAQRAAILRAAVGERRNRRHRPGRAFERTSYRFDIVADYGAFRDLQRHRMLTLEWQPLSPRHGYSLPPEVEAAGRRAEWTRVMDSCAPLHERLLAAHGPLLAQYAVPMAYRVRYALQMNAREAMHLLELRTAPQGHPAYRTVCQAMHRLIAERHPAIAAAMSFVNHDAIALERLEAEVRAERRRGE